MFTCYNPHKGGRLRILSKGCTMDIVRLQDNNLPVVIMPSTNLSRGRIQSKHRRCATDPAVVCALEHDDDSSLRTTATCTDSQIDDTSGGDPLLVEPSTLPYLSSVSLVSKRCMSECNLTLLSLTTSIVES